MYEPIFESDGFHFRIYHYVEGEYDGEDSPEGYSVSLPHQCDAWDITGAYEGPIAKEKAVERLEEFIAEAQQTVNILKTDVGTCEFTHSHTQFFCRNVRCRVS